MNVLKFNLSGETAFFKKPDVNTYIYFTYGQIHKIAILGILGSCLGLKGYNQQEENEFPEFYEQLNSLKIGIVPKSSSNGTIRKKVQSFNNSTMFCNKGSNGYGANLIVNEQWLEKPNWDIYVLLEDNDICNNLEHSFTNRLFKYIPYLGKNDHLANIDDMEVFKEVYKPKDIFKIHSLFKKDVFKFIDEVNEDRSYGKSCFKYQEKLPHKLESTTNQYILDTFIFSNMSVSPMEILDVYNVNGLNIYFI